MTRVALVWHMHQPFYKDLVTGEHLLPWVRLHAIKDYVGMVSLLDEFPDVHATFNLVPSLLTQVEEFASDSARDPALDLSLKPADQLTPGDVLFMLRNFFHANGPQMIQTSPRYAELLERRGPAAPTGPAGDLTQAFSVDDLRDLQVWHKLVWIDPSVAARDDRIRALVARGRQFSEADKLTLRDVELELLRAVVPAYRAASDRGQVELSASPFYHPILPLLCDTDVYRQIHPEAPLPARPFRHPEDALEQLVRARACFERLFGRAPAGLWPSEGAVSNAVVPLAVQAGFTWMATDEGVLARSLGTALTRDAHGHVHQPELLYRPYMVQAGGARIACAFRDHALSDLIGFTYANWGPEDAARDFVGRLIAAGRHFAARTGGDDALVTVILDGENAWEHFEGGGRPFLRALYGGLSSHPELTTVTMADGCGGAARTLDGVAAGSWIDADLYVWIGHADDRRAWDQLSEARAAIEASTGTAPDAKAEATEELLIAEGSDWFWWYGDDRSSEHDREFDDLFRRHLRNVYSLLGRPIPDDLFVTNMSTEAGRGRALLAPLALLTPAIDGDETSYFEWLGAGRFDVVEVTGAMHQSTRRRSAIGSILFAFDRDAFHVRIDGPEALRAELDEGRVLSLEFLMPPRLRVAVRRTANETRAELLEQEADGRWAATGRPVRAAVGRIAEVSVPLATLGHLTERESGILASIRELQFFVTMRTLDGLETERHPQGQPVVAMVPDATFESQHWRV